MCLVQKAQHLSTIQQGLYALTTLLADENNQEQVLGQGGIAAVIELCGHASPVIREACSLALFNFSCGKAPHERGISASAIPAIIALSRLPEPRTRMRCAATLCKLAAFEANVSLMVDEGVVSAFIDMLQTGDQDIVKHCCVARVWWRVRSHNPHILLCSSVRCVCTRAMSSPSLCHGDTRTSHFTGS